MTLMILAHPQFEHSIANKTISDIVSREEPNLEIRNIHQLYPNYQIDVKAEQTALLAHDLVILQYPMYWFNMPAILKIWFDEVFTYQFAYGSKGNKLKGKYLLPSLTIGQPAVNFKEKDHFLVDDFLQPVKRSAEYAQMNYLDYIALYGVSIVSGYPESEIKDKACMHAQKLLAVIQQYK